MEILWILEMLYINCKMNLILSWYADCVISKKEFAIAHAKLYVPVVTWSIDDKEFSFCHLKIIHSEHYTQDILLQL